MSMGFATTLRNNRAQTIIDYVGASGLLRIYSGTRPATGGSVGSSVLLAQLTLGAVLGTISNGVLQFNTILPASSAAASGVAAWARVVKADGTTFCFDMSAGTVSAGVADLRLDDVNVVLGGTVAIQSGQISEGNL